MTAATAAGLMTAVVKTRSGVGNVGLMDVPEPVCGPGKVKVEIKYCGICGTDIHVFHDRFRNYPPVILGHEFSGIVVETGEGVRSIGAGDRVTVLGSSAVVCGTCEYCVRGYYMFCPVRRGMGHGVNGAFTKYAVVREDQVYKLPDSLSLEEAALTEPFASAVQPIEELASVHPGDTVLLSGPGPIGLLCLTLLVSHRAKVLVAGTNDDESRLDLAIRLGADATVDVSRDDIDEAVCRFTGGRGVDIAVECSGNAVSHAACLRAVRPLGQYVQVGIAGKEIQLPFDTVLYKQLHVLGSVGHSLATWRRAMAIFEQKKITLEPLISHVLPLSRWREGFDLCENKQGVKVLLQYDGI
jgi:L-iditol 2-dehydrogenase